MHYLKNGLQRRYLGRERYAGRFQRGASAFELLLLSFPVCLLTMVISSKLAATSTTRLRAQWQSSLAAQQGAVNTCGSHAQLVTPWMDQKSANIAISSHSKVTQFAAVAGVPANLQSTIIAHQKLEKHDETRKVTDTKVALDSIGAVGGLLPGLTPRTTAASNRIKDSSSYPPDLLTQSQLLATNWSANVTTLNPSSYYFKPLADRLMPESDPSLAAGAAFVCNEPAADANDEKYGQRDRLRRIHDQLIGWMFLESERLH